MWSPQRPCTVAGGLPVQGARAFGSAFRVDAHVVCVRRVCGSQNSSLFVNTGFEDQGRGFLSEVLGSNV